MEDPSTQPATQPFLDPRRQGSKSMLNERDASDVLCILHPGSPAAYRAVQIIAKDNAEHILQNPNPPWLSQDIDQDRITNKSNPVEKMADNQAELLAKSKNYQSDFQNDDDPLDIALRLSSRLMDPCLGFTFGRIKGRCDLLIGVEENRDMKISGMHFRIFLNRSGVLMLQDTSTNGTYVDDVELQGPKGRRSPRDESQRMISSGSVIEILLSSSDEKKVNVLKFIVKIPSRDNARERWQRNLKQYMMWLGQTQRRDDMLTQAVANGKDLTVPAPLNPLGFRPVEAHSPDLNSRTLAAGTEEYNYGMEWNGGETYNVVGYIGKGAFACVYQLATKRDGELYAAKQIEKRKFVKHGVLDQKINNEMTIMKNLRHPNIVEFIEHHDSSRHLYIIMEYVPCGDLTSYINSGSVMAEYLCQSVAHQMCQALEYLHHANITHRDIKPDNILIKSRDPLVVKLTDFGLSKVITNEDSFLKTFCGTLLYCAPEVYPGYDQYKRGLPRKRQRPGDPPPKTLPYKQSVDIWALAAVLYHLLCGNPPFEGSSQDRGAQMLENVMQTPINYGKLKNAGVSGDGIDFISKMLVLDPAARSNESECLQHRWIVETKAEDPSVSRMEGVSRELDAIAEAADELDASQLSLIDNVPYPDIAAIADELSTDGDESGGVRESKRFKSAKYDSTRLRSSLSSSQYGSYASLPDDQVDLLNHAPRHDGEGTNRLFGEIGASALRSSGILGYDAHLALQVPLERSHNESFDTSASQFVNYVNDAQLPDDGVAQPHLQYPQTLPAPVFTGSAPSLFGAEALVGQLNMASPESTASVASPESIHGTPKTPKSRGQSPFSTSAIFGSKRSSQILQVTAEQTTPKRTKTSRLSESSHGSHRIVDPFPTQPYVPQASSVPGKHAAARQSQQIDAQSSRKDSKSGDDDARDEKRDEKPASKPKTSLNDNSSRSLAVSHAKGNVILPLKRGPSSPESSKATSIDSVQAGSPLEDSALTRPSQLFGLITAVPGSICDTAIRLDNRITRYGRDVTNDVQYGDPLDVRVPKNALNIIFWRPGIEALIDIGQDWRKVEDLWAIIHTGTSQSIRVNEVKLTKGKNGWNFGRLHTGDIITIFDRKEPEKPAEFLKFRCEFYAGASKREREDDEPRFVVEREEEKFMQMQMRKSGQSVGGSQDSIGDRQNIDPKDQENLVISK